MLDEPFADMPEELAALVETLRGRGIDLIDKRWLNGALWVVAKDPDTAEAVSSLPKDKYIYGFAPRGGKTSKHKPAWWIKERDLSDCIREKHGIEEDENPIQDIPFEKRLEALLERARTASDQTEPNLPLENLQDSEETEHPETSQAQQTETKCCLTCAYFKPKPDSFLGKCDYHGFPEISNDYCCGRWTQSVAEPKEQQ